MGTSTLSVVAGLKSAVGDEGKLTHSDIDLKVVMDQSEYVRNSIASLAEEGAARCGPFSLVSLVFLGQWRMTVMR